MSWTHPSSIYDDAENRQKWSSWKRALYSYISWLCHLHSIEWRNNICIFISHQSRHKKINHIWLARIKPTLYYLAMSLSMFSLFLNQMFTQMSYLHYSMMYIIAASISFYSAVKKTRSTVIPNSYQRNANLGPLKSTSMLHINR